MTIVLKSRASEVFRRGDQPGADAAPAHRFGNRQFGDVEASAARLWVFLVQARRETAERAVAHGNEECAVVFAHLLHHALKVPLAKVPVGRCVVRRERGFESLKCEQKIDDVFAVGGHEHPNGYVRTTHSSDSACC
jgi:hypothetical protein